ncbi:hypothetical protein C2I18_05865 [Paenibacillus sp. PK3_47]|uniref:alpha-1,2-fucosyltransferase n=1 Tax=Paenibacillus sp. PK3_47 TaxID=2072642 RepID=UPI00201DE969|nr:alpha-1,2-fucosyltransferase [Paenibacillus sp. PK3_47]UQZ33124.1 hypothetical protein C2I18_05865 [Paenibacillus sp. PK3_47]
MMLREKKIILRVMGGLGNQLFQYGYARYLQEIYDADIYLDLQEYKKYKVRSFSLDNFQLNDRIHIFDKNKISKKDFLLYTITRKMYHLMQYCVRKITRKNKMGNTLFDLLTRMGLIYNFDVFYYKHKKIDKVRNLFVYGYFQSPFYFDLIEEELRKELIVKKEFMNNHHDLLNEVSSTNSVAVSIRCGSDYLSTDLNVFSEEFFYKSMKHIENHVSDAKFYIFSDDIKKCKELFSFKQEVTYLDNMTDYEGISIMTNCKHFVISNSSFSWFGAYLSTNVDKIIIAPKMWYRKKNEGEDIYLPNMIRM